MRFVEIIIILKLIFDSESSVFRSKSPLRYFLRDVYKAESQEESLIFSSITGNLDELKLELNIIEKQEIHHAKMSSHNRPLQSSQSPYDFNTPQSIKKDKKNGILEPIIVSPQRVVRNMDDNEKQSSILINDNLNLVSKESTTTTIKLPPHERKRSLREVMTQIVTDVVDDIPIPSHTNYDSINNSNRPNTTGLSETLVVHALSMESERPHTVPISSTHKMGSNRSMNSVLSSFSPTNSMKPSIVVQDTVIVIPSIEASVDIVDSSLPIVDDGEVERNMILINNKTEVSVTQSVFVNKVANLPDYQQKYGGGFDQSTGLVFFSNWGAAFKDPPVKVSHPLDVAALNVAFPQFNQIPGAGNDVTDVFLIIPDLKNLSTLL